MISHALLSATKGLLIAGSLMATAPHPIHTTVLDLTWEERARTVHGVLRIFEDDLLAASSRVGVSAYVLQHVELTAGGRPIALETCGERRSADAVLICLRGAAQDSRSWRIRNTLLMDRFDDQVNIVRIEKNGASTLLLTRASSARTVR